MTVQCCCCGHIRNDAGDWSAPAGKPDELVSHTYCEECFQEELVRIAEHRAFMKQETVAA